MGKSAFQSKSQSKKAAAVQKRADNTVIVEAPARAVSGDEHSAAGVVTIPKDVGTTAGKPAIKTMPIATTAIGNKVLRIVEGPAKKPISLPNRPARPIQWMNNSVLPKAGTKSHTSPTRPKKVEYLPAPAPTHNAWGNTAGLKEVKSAEKVADMADTKSSTSPLQPTKVEYRPATAPTHNAWCNAAGIKKLKSPEKVTDKAATRSTAPAPEMKAVAPEAVTSAFPGLPASPKEPSQSSTRQTAKKGGKKTKSAAAVHQTTTDETRNAPKEPNNSQKKTVVPSKDVSVNTKPASKDTKALVAVPVIKQQVIGGKKAVDAKVIRKQDEIASAEAQATPSQVASEPVPSTTKSKKKSGAAQKKAKAARHRAAAEASLDAAFAVASLAVEQTPLSKDIEELKELYSKTPTVEATRRAKLMEDLVVLQNKNIDIAELGEANWIILDKNGEVLSDKDQEMAAGVCKDYKAYQTVCQEIALAQRAEQAVIMIEEGQRIFGAPTSDAFSWENAKYSKLPLEKIVEARQSSPQPEEPLFTAGNFDFKLDDDAPKYKKAFPIASRKLEFSADVFGTPDSPVQGPVSNSPEIMNASPVQLDEAPASAEDATPAEVTDVPAVTLEIEALASPIEALSTESSAKDTSEAVHFDLSTTIDVDVSVPDGEAPVEYSMDDAASDTVLESPPSPVDSPELSTTEIAAEAADTTTTTGLLQPVEPDQDGDMTAAATNNTTATQESVSLDSSVEELSSVVPATGATVQDLDLKTSTDEEISTSQPEIKNAATIEEIEEATTNEDVSELHLEIEDVLFELSEVSTPATADSPDESTRNRVGIVPTMPSNIGNRDAIKRDVFFSTFNRDNVSTKTKTDSDSGIHNPATSESSVLPADSADTQDHGPTHEEMETWAQAASRHSGFAPAVSDTKPAEKSSRLNTTQIGITTLREFYTSLPDAAASTHAKVDLIAAFVAMSSVEREELDLGPSHAYHAKAVLANMKLQHRIFLGNIKLVEFLKTIDFNTDGEASDAAVVQAWEECAKKDAQAEALEARLTQG